MRFRSSRTRPTSYLQLSVELFIGEALQQVRAVDETALEAVDGPRQRLDEPRRVDDDDARQDRVVGEVDEAASSMKVLQHQLNVCLGDVKTSRYRHHLHVYTHCGELIKGKPKRPIIASVERHMYYNNNTTQHSLLREEIIENERN